MSGEQREAQASKAQATNPHAQPASIQAEGETPSGIEQDASKQARPLPDAVAGVSRGGALEALLKSGDLAGVIAEELPSGGPVLVALSGVVVLDDMQVRLRTDGKLVRSYAQAMKHGALFPPVKLARIANTLYLVDGFHRVEALRANHRGDTLADIVDVGSLEEARWLAAEANLRHGKQLTRKEKREVFRAYIKARKHCGEKRKGRLKSYREIAAELGGMPHATIVNWMREDFPQVAKRMGMPERGRAMGGPGGVRNVGYASEAARQAKAALETLRLLLPVLDGEARMVLLRGVTTLADKLGTTGLNDIDF